MREVLHPHLGWRDVLFQLPVLLLHDHPGEKVNCILEWSLVMNLIQGLTDWVDVLVVRVVLVGVLAAGIEFQISPEF